MKGSENRKHIATRSLVLVVLALSVFSLTSSARQAFATDQTCGGSGGAVGSETTNCASAISTGDTIYILVWNNNAAAVGGCNTPVVTDTIGNSFSLIASNDCTLMSSYYQIFIFGAKTISSAASDTITCSVPGAGTRITACSGIVEGNKAQLVASATCKQNIENVGIGTPVSCTTSVAFDGTADTIIGAIYLAGGVGIWGAGFSTTSSNMDSVFGPNGEYCIPTCSTVTSPTAFPFTSSTNSGSNVMEVGAVIPNQADTIVAVSPCTFFELQCWLYPIFFFSVYMAMIVGVATKADVPKGDMEGHVLEALSLSTLMGVMMGMTNIMLPLIITVFQVIRAMRA